MIRFGVTENSCPLAFCRVCQQEIETFCLRAVEDTRGNVKRMENARTDYRAALNWMKDVSQELDPDANAQLDRFKNVQTEVKKSKQQFDHHKLVCLQKVDLLAAARCNMFSHVLIFYQQSMQRFAETVAESFENATKDFKREPLLDRIYSNRHK